MKRYLIIISLLTVSFITADKPVKKHFRYCKTVENAFINASGNLNGKFERVYDGHVIETGNYNDGLKTGKWISTNPEGHVIKQISYANGLLDGQVVLFFAYGKPRVTGIFNNGLKNGKWTYYDNKGRVIKTGLFNNGVPKGIWVFYNDDGKSIIEKYDFDKNRQLADNRISLHFSDEEVKFKSSYMNKNYRYREVIDVPSAGARPLGGYRKTKELFAGNFELPQDIWFTYLTKTFYTSFKVLANGSFGDIDVSLAKKSYLPYRTSMDLNFYTEYSNNDLQHINIDERSLLHFAEKVKEDLEIFYGPWILGSHDNVVTSLQMNFVVNKE